MSPHESRVPETRCPKCGAGLDGVTSLRGFVPTPGAIAICAYCGQTLVFMPDLTQRAATEAEIAEFERDSLEFRATRAVMARFRLYRHAKKAGEN